MWFVFVASLLFFCDCVIFPFLFMVCQQQQQPNFCINLVQVTFLSRLSLTSFPILPHFTLCLFPLQTYKNEQIEQLRCKWKRCNLCVYPVSLFVVYISSFLTFSNLISYPLPPSSHSPYFCSLYLRNIPAFRWYLHLSYNFALCLPYFNSKSFFVIYVFSSSFL